MCSLTVHRAQNCINAKAEFPNHSLKDYVLSRKRTEGVKFVNLLYSKTLFKHADHVNITDGTCKKNKKLVLEVSCLQGFRKVLSYIVYWSIYNIRYFIVTSIKVCVAILCLKQDGEICFPLFHTDAPSNMEIFFILFLFLFHTFFALCQDKYLIF